MDELHDGAPASADEAVRKPQAGEPQPNKSIDAIIERWWADHFPGSEVARYTQAWNTAFSAKEALKALLRRQVQGD
jgi:hypothetical protein